MSHLFWLCWICSLASPKEGSVVANNEQASPQVTVENVILALTQKVPGNLAELEAIVGPLHRDIKDEAFALTRKNLAADLGALSVSFAIDSYHRDPYQQKNPAIDRLGLTFAKGFSQCQEAFRNKFGQEKTYQQGARQVLRFDTGVTYGPQHVAGYYLFHAKGEGFELEWNPKVPKFAIPKRTVQEEGALIASILTLFKEKITRSRIESTFGKLTQDPQMNRDLFTTETFAVASYPAGQESPKRFTILFGPPLPAKAMIKALGILDPVVVSTDVHMTSLVMADYKTRGYPSAGGFKLYVNVLDQGLKDTNLKWPASSVRKADAYLITSIEGMIEEGQ